MFRMTTLALLVGSATCAWAQDDTLTLPASNVTATANQPKEATSLDLDRPIESGSRLNLSARENPASISVADRKTMERIGARNFQDAANALPGVNASAPPGWGGYVAYRGFNGAQISQLFNGINLQYGGAARPVGAWIYDRVELLGGPSSFLNGSGAVGGSLNFITRLASRDEDTFEGRVSYARYDTMETSVAFNKALNTGDGPRHHARLDYSRTSTNGYIDRQENGAGNLAFSLLSDINEKLSHTLAIEYLEEQEDSPYWGTPVLQPLVGTLHIQAASGCDAQSAGSRSSAASVCASMSIQHATTMRPSIDTGAPARWACTPIRRNSRSMLQNVTPINWRAPRRAAHSTAAASIGRTDQARLPASAPSSGVAAKRDSSQTWAERGAGCSSASRCGNTSCNR